MSGSQIAPKTVCFLIYLRVYFIFKFGWIFVLIVIGFATKPTLRHFYIQSDDDIHEWRTVFIRSWSRTAFERSKDLATKNLEEWLALIFLKQFFWKREPLIGGGYGMKSRDSAFLLDGIHELLTLGAHLPTFRWKKKTVECSQSRRLRQRIDNYSREHQKRLLRPEVVDDWEFF